MSTMHTEERIGEAWRLHRVGDNPAAIDIFKDILSKAPKLVDAHYGLGLALRADGKNDEAVKSFQEALTLAQGTLNAVDTAAESEGHRGTNNLDSYEDDRYLMLVRMIEQRLSELGA